jgi:hypothetical protein
MPYSSAVARLASSSASEKLKSDARDLGVSEGDLLAVTPAAMLAAAVSEGTYFSLSVVLETPRVEFDPRVIAEKKLKTDLESPRGDGVVPQLSPLKTQLSLSSATCGFGEAASAVVAGLVIGLVASYVWVLSTLLNLTGLSAKDAS